MNLYCFTDAAFAYLKNTVKNHFEEVEDKYHETSPWSVAYLEDAELPGEVTMIADRGIKEINLILPTSDNPKEKSKDDINNCIRVYDALKYLPPSVAADPRLWSYLCHETFYEYMVKRWPIEKGADTVNERYFTTSGGARTRYRNGISRLWWIPHLTYDENLDDPYSLTRVILRRQDDMENFMGRNLNLNRKVLHAMLHVLKDKNIEEYSRNVLRDLLEDINKIGGVSVLDALPEEKLIALFSRKYAEHVALNNKF